MLCKSLFESLSEPVFGERDTEPDDMVEERLVTSDVESKVADTGLEAMTSPFRSMGGMAVVSKVLSGTLGNE